MKINLSYQFKTLSGKDFDKVNNQGEVIEQHNMAKCLATALWFSAGKNLKFALWSQELYKTGSFDIDETDLDLLITWIEIYGEDPNKNFIPWFAQVGVKIQVIDILKKQKEKNAKK